MLEYKPSLYEPFGLFTEETNQVKTFSEYISYLQSLKAQDFSGYFKNMAPKEFAEILRYPIIGNAAGFALADLISKNIIKFPSWYYHLAFSLPISLLYSIGMQHDYSKFKATQLFEFCEKARMLEFVINHSTAYFIHERSEIELISAFALSICSALGLGFINYHLEQKISLPRGLRILSGAAELAIFPGIIMETIKALTEEKSPSKGVALGSVITCSFIGFANELIRINNPNFSKNADKVVYITRASTTALFNWYFLNAIYAAGNNGFIDDEFFATNTVINSFFAIYLSYHRLPNNIQKHADNLFTLIVRVIGGIAAGHAATMGLKEDLLPVEYLAYTAMGGMALINLYGNFIKNRMPVISLNDLMKYFGLSMHSITASLKWSLPTIYENSKFFHVANALVSIVPAIGLTWGRRNFSSLPTWGKYLFHTGESMLISQFLLRMLNIEVNAGLTLQYSVPISIATGITLGVAKQALHKSYRTPATITEKLQNWVLEFTLLALALSLISDNPLFKLCALASSVLFAAFMLPFNHNQYQSKLIPDDNTGETITQIQFYDVDESEHGSQIDKNQERTSSGFFKYAHKFSGCLFFCNTSKYHTLPRAHAEEDDFDELLLDLEAIPSEYTSH